MRVEDLYASGNLEASQAAATQTGRAQPAEAVAPKGDRSAGVGAAARQADRVQLSELTSRLAIENPQRAAQLERLAAEVQAGRYRVEAAAVSRSLVEEALRGG